MATIVFNTKISKIENKIPETSSLVTRNVLNTKISEVENKIPDQATQECNKVLAENFGARLKQANLVTKTYFDNKLISLDRKITSNKISI